MDDRMVPDRARAVVDEVRTRRLVVVDPDGWERVVAEVVAGHAEVRVALGPPHSDRTTALVLFAGAGYDEDLWPGLGLQLWADGDTLLEVQAWREPSGRWVTDVFVESTPDTT